ncbi:Sir2 family NAD-dependent protein deacetylase, partial [Promineifilum sp.]|uniref:Sir2 family NAD-dependent protein deacetylase n=1 Tax=Promineifilum sp. TaxID=2664178 RepID=UPI0035AF0AED
MNDDARIAQATDLIHEARHVVALTGAGISTPSGIPDYRTPQSGLWEKAVDMAEVATIYAFRHRPQAFYDWLRPLLHVVLAAQPNP